ncbi:Chloroperoxidase [Leptodontidium sp. MPI-SDFR-AT-0119]|nr:Chloroperoxidase [Leptodontidium sp. MPI-SDFR-AT-0119]
MRKTLQTLVLALPLVTAWPAVMEAVQNGENLEASQKRQAVFPNVPPPKFTTGRDNCGSYGKCTVFNAQDQFVDVRPGSGHEFQAPGANDKRGQCPGLNAAANHGFLPHNGIATTQQTIDGLGAAYSMSPELALALAVISIAISGDPIAGKWSIGGSFPGTLGLLGTPTGIVGTHNRYEGNASIVRGDAYMNGGNVGVFEMHRWERLYSLAASEGGLTHDKVASQAYYTAEYSIKNNPYYFSNPFSGLVAPDAHNFVVHLMSNRSADNMGGVLNGEVLKSFFAVTGTPGNFVHNRGMERIPDNCGNTGTVNSFVGVDTGDLTGGVFNGASLLEGNSLSCFFFQATMAGLADAAIPVLEPIGQVLDLLSKNLGPQIQGHNCPQLSNFNNGL